MMVHIFKNITIFLGLFVAIPLNCQAVYKVGDFDSNGTTDFRYYGSGASEKLLVVDYPQLGQIVVSVDANGDGDFTDSKDIDSETITAKGKFETFEIYMQSGKDEFHYELGGDLTAQRRNFYVDSGKSNDKVEFDFNGYTISSSQIVLQVNTASGHDSLNISLSKLIDSSIEETLDLGNGYDTLEIHEPSSLQSSVLRTRVNMDRDSDKIYHTTATTMVDSTLSFEANLGDGNDDVSENLDFYQLFGRSNLTIRYNGENGKDSLSGNTDCKTNNCLVEAESRFGFEFSGGNHNDTFYMAPALSETTTNKQTIAGRVDWIISGGDGKDQINLAAGGVNAFQFDAGGSYGVRIFGDNGNDNITFSIPPVLGGVPLIDININGGQGSDKISGLISDATPYGYAPYTAPLLDGGTGKDTVVASSQFVKINFP